jgi:hypothetical protein
VRSRLVAILLVAAAALLDEAGAHGPATAALVAAVPVAAAAALLTLGAALERPHAAEWVQAWLAGAAGLLTLAAAALRTPLAPAGDPPAAAAATLAVCLVVLGLQALVAGVVALGWRPPALTQPPS